MALLMAAAIPMIVVAYEFGPPPGVSGAPGAPDRGVTCTSCHFATLNSGPGRVTISFPPPSYSSGTTYPITVNVSDPTQRRWGFQLSVRTGANQQAGTLIPGTDKFTQLTAPPTLSGIQFITHTTQGTQLGTRNEGRFNFQWQAPAVSAGPVTFYVAANAANGDNSSFGDRIYTRSLAVPPEAAPPPPTTPSINDGGVVSNASFAPSPAPIAPGTLLAIFGTNLTQGGVSVNDTSLGPDGKLVTTLGGASVKINGIAAPMLRAFPTQLVAQMPTELTAIGPATIEATVGGQTSASRTFNVDAVSPGIFSTSASGSGQGAILNGLELNQGISSLAAPTGSFPRARPARAGEVVVIFCTGLGQVAPPVATGALATQHTTVATPTVTLDGLPAEVLFSGLAPGFAGLYQVNARVPAAARLANEVPLALHIGGKQSNLVTIAVGQ